MPFQPISLVLDLIYVCTLYSLILLLMMLQIVYVPWLLQQLSSQVLDGRGPFGLGSNPGGAVAVTGSAYCPNTHIIRTANVKAILTWGIIRFVVKTSLRLYKR